MPTYEYACTSCENRIEVFQSFSDDPLETCEKCGGKLRRVFHPVGVMFKGSGFYSTDAKISKSKARDRAAASSEKKDSKGDSKAGESTSAGTKSAESSSTSTSSGSGSGSSSDSGSGSTPASKPASGRARNNPDG